MRAKGRGSMSCLGHSMEEEYWRGEKRLKERQEASWEGFLSLMEGLGLVHSPHKPQYSMLYKHTLE